MEEKKVEEGRKRKNRKKRSLKKKIALVFLVIFLILLIIAGILFGMVAYKLGKINFGKLDESQLGINNDLYNQVSDNISKDEFDSIKNVALFGIDGGRSDAIIIASINQKNHSIKLLSIPRDTYVEVDGYGNTKINHAYAYGKEQLAIKTINSNFGLNITEYVTINFNGFINVINKIGGIELDITKEEKDYINEYVQGEAYEITGRTVPLLSSYGKVKLTGEQALTHSRNRTIGNDFDREERQRLVIEAVMNKVSKMSINQIWNLSDSILEEIGTNLDINECMDIISNALSNKNEYLNNITSRQLPSTEEGSGQTIDGLYYFVCDLDEVSEMFRDIIYNSK